MDPIANLNEQRRIVVSMQKLRDSKDELSNVEIATLAHDGLRLAELCEALDTWMTSDGCSPWLRGQS